jgi:hypothetical protein
MLLAETTLTRPDLTVPDTYVIVTTGARDHRDYDLIGTSLWETINSAPATCSTIVLRHGACPTGADDIITRLCARQAAGERLFPRRIIEDPMPADWDGCGIGCLRGPHRKKKRPGDVHHPGRRTTYCPKAGPRRNAAMLTSGLISDLPADLVLGFPLPGSWGTKSCMALAAATGIPVIKKTR